MNSTYIKELDTTLVTFNIKVASMQEVPVLVKKRGTITAYELQNTFDVRVADGVISAIKSHVQEKQKMKVSCVGKLQYDGIYIYYSVVLKGRVDVSDVQHINEEYALLEDLVS